MKLDPDFDADKSWRWLLQQIILAKNAFRVGNVLGPDASKSLYDLLLPSLLYLRSVSLLDEVLASYIHTNGLVVRNPYRQVLHGRLSFLNDQGLLTYCQCLLDIKGKRNQLAHRSNKAETASSMAVAWDELDHAINMVEGALQELSIVGTRPDFQFHYGRDVDHYFDESHPDNPDIMMAHHYYYGVKEGETWTIKFKQSYNYHGLP